MLISIHSHQELLAVEIEPRGERRSLWIDFGPGQSILLSQQEAAHLIAQLQGGLDRIDADDADQAELADLAVIESIPMFGVADA